MTSIFVGASAAQSIIGQLKAGELEVHGILLRDTVSKKFRYILRGFEHLPANVQQLGGMPPLEPLQAAIGMTQLMQVVSIAQSAALAVTLQRIESRLDKIDSRMAGIERRLRDQASSLSVIRAALNAQPISRLRAAKTAAAVARQHKDQTALIAAGKDAQQAFHELLAQARSLIDAEAADLPVVLHCPAELAGLCENGADAAYVASAIWMTLHSPRDAAKIMCEAAEVLQSVRDRLADIFTARTHLLQRIEADKGNDNALLEVARRLQNASHSCLGRALMIKLGGIIPGEEDVSFEKAEQLCEPTFVSIEELESN